MYSIFTVPDTVYKHTHIPVVGPAPDALTSSLLLPSPPLQSSSVSSDRRSRTPPQWTAPREREEEKRGEMEREKELEKAWTLHSPHSLQPCQENEFLTQHKRAFLSASLSSIFLPSAFLCSAFSSLSLLPPNFPSFFLSLSLKERYFSANDFKEPSQIQLP